MSSQYRTPLSFTAEALKAAKGALRRLDRARDRLAAALSAEERGDGADAAQGGDGALAAAIGDSLADFEEALVDDLSMPRAAAR